MRQRLQEFKGFKVGDTVQITKCPDKYSGVNRGRNPFRLSYPRYFLIKEIILLKNAHPWADYVCMVTEKNYNFDLGDLIGNRIIKAGELEFQFEN